MSAPEILALSLGLSIAVAVVAWAASRLIERVSADPNLRDRAWGGALALSALPPLAVGALLLVPPSVRDTPALRALAAPGDFLAAATPSTVPIDITVDIAGFAAWSILAAAALLTAGRLAGLALRVRRLVRLIRRSRSPGPEVLAMVERAARDLDVKPPRVRISDETPDALLAAPGHIHLILPAALIDAGDPGAARVAVAHELAHLKRRDHHALWLEEALLALLAFNPLAPVLRARRVAAREEACDAEALIGASPEVRRAYARCLVDVLRNRAGSQDAPSLFFTGVERKTARHRLTSILNPAPRPDARPDCSR